MFDFKRIEKEALDHWRDNKIFEKSLALRQDQGKRFVFFEGPPTANGRPGIHHFLGRAFKDLYGRYKTMRGFFVLRKAGWDTHGLPVELEIEKELGFKSKKDIEKYGIAKFNKKARESVWKYKREWEDMTRRMGYWLDMDRPYITYENNYIESLWAIIKKIWDKKLLYLAHRVVPFCTRCGTGLSSHEVAQGYKTITDKSVVVKFLISNFEFLKNDLKLNDLKPKTYILAWTTTPWTLPGNVALAVGRDITYALVKKGDEHYILAKELLDKVFGDEYFESIKELKGVELVGLEYEPLFDVNELKSDKSYRIYAADFVTTSEGTGVVHTAVMYGEDDYKLGTEAGLPKHHTVDEAGKFVHVNKELDGKYVKDKKTEKLIIRELESKNLLFKIEDFEHDYPFCWRCDSPLLYYAKNSWFIKMSAVRDKLLANNSKINWVPEHLKEGRFGQWIKEGKDWAFSRERYWATALPIWECVKCDHKEIIGSLKDLHKKAIGRNNIYYGLRHSYSERHEEKEKNEIIIGTDLSKDKYHLTAKGKEIIHKRAEELIAQGGVDIIFTSPFLRAKESAEIVGKLLHVDVVKDDRLSEISYGLACEGKTGSQCQYKDKKISMDSAHEGGESDNDVRSRMMDFMNYLDSKYSGKRILIVSHGDPLFLLRCMSVGQSGYHVLKEKMEGKWYPDVAGLYKIDWETIPRNDLGELDFHRPFIDKIFIKCKKCQASMKRVPDVIDVWFDSGAMPFAQWHWPFDTAQGKPYKKVFASQYPADFIVEAIDQTRGWFYTLLAISTLLGKGAPYKNVISFSHVLDEKGHKMSKSKGNVVSPFEVMDKYGADAARWYFYVVSSPGEPKLFSMKDVELRLKGFMSTLSNCLRFYEIYSTEIRNSSFEIRNSNLLDKWINSRLNGLVLEVTENLDKYRPTVAARAIEKFVVDDLSKWWLRRSRKRDDARPMLRVILLELSKILAPFIPFTAEHIHSELHRGTNAGTESVHLHDWLKVNKKLINKKLEEEMDGVRNIVTLGLAQRKERQMKVRQPLKSVKINLASKLDGDFETLIKEELNVKAIDYDKPSTKAQAKENIVELDFELTHALKNEGYARELIRQLQGMRKDAKYDLKIKVNAKWHTDNAELSSAVREWGDEIKKDVLLNNFENRQQDNQAFDVEKEFDISSGKKIWLGVHK
jgi:isoleucyl-tRNA synthetase